MTGAGVGIRAVTGLMVAGLAGGVLTGCGESDPSGPTSSVVGVASSDAELGTLTAALLAAGLDDALAGQGPFTVFAPSDAAFEALSEGVVDALLASGNGDVLEELLLGHVVAGEYGSGDLMDGQVLTTLSGDLLEVDLAGGSVTVGGAVVQRADVGAANGVVHVVGSVLTGGLDVVERARVTPDLSTLVSAVVAAELAETLGGAGPFTVFAPVNSAFAALDAEVVGRLLEPENRALLQKVLTYHVVSGRVLAADLEDGSDVETVSGGTIRIDLAGGATANGAGIIATDIAVENGVVHLIDGVLLENLDLVDVAVLNGFEALVGAVQAAGLESALRDPASSLTVFAPTDAAFGAIGPVSSDPEVLQSILLYHVVGSEAYSASLSDAQVLTTLQGGTLTVRLGSGVAVEGAVNDAGVVAADVPASNGVIHVVDAVLLPPTN